MSFFTRRKNVDVSGSGAGGFAADEYPPLKKHFTKKNIRFREGPKAIAEAFLADFPNGEFYSMETSGENNWCGLHAIRNSMLAYVRQNPLVHVRAPTIPELLKALTHATKEFKKWSKKCPGYKVPRNFFNGDELREIFKAWAFKLGGLDKNRWGGVQLGFVTASESVEGVKQLPLVLNRQLEILESESRLPILRIWIFHNGNEHWEGIDQGPREEAKQMLPQLNHHQPEMRPWIHPLPVGQSTLPSGGIQPQQYPQQPPMAFPSPVGDSDPFLGSCYNNPSPVRRLRSLTPDELYKARTLYKLGLEMKVEAQKRAYGISSTPPPAPSSYAGLWLEPAPEFPPSSWMTPVTPIPQLVPIPYRPPGFLVWTGLGPVPESLYQSTSFAPTPDPPLFLPGNQSRQQGQLQRGGSQAPTPQPPMSRATSRQRMLSPEPEDNEGQEEEGRKKKTCTGKKGKDKLPREGV